MIDSQDVSKHSKEDVPNVNFTKTKNKEIKNLENSFATLSTDVEDLDSVETCCDSEESPNQDFSLLSSINNYKFKENFLKNDSSTGIESTYDRKKQLNYKKKVSHSNRNHCHDDDDDDDDRFRKSRYSCCLTSKQFNQQKVSYNKHSLNIMAAQPIQSDYQSFTGGDNNHGRKFFTNWGLRSNLIDQNGIPQRSTFELKNYICYYKSKYSFYFGLISGRYPQFVRKLENSPFNIWRMSFNIFSTGISNLIVHLGEIHAFYRMENINGEIRWVYKDFNFYPNSMEYGFHVDYFTITDIYSRFIKFVCIRDHLIKQFPYVDINSFDNNQSNFQSFKENLQKMMECTYQVGGINYEIKQTTSNSLNYTAAANAVTDGRECSDMKMINIEADKQPNKIHRYSISYVRGGGGIRRGTNSTRTNSTFAGNHLVCNQSFQYPLPVCNGNYKQ